MYNMTFYNEPSYLKGNSLSDICCILRSVFFLGATTANIPSIHYQCRYINNYLKPIAY